MTASEISARVDSILQRASEGITVDEYKKSVYLTEAQEFFVSDVLSKYEYGDYIRHVLGPVLGNRTVTSFTSVKAGEYIVAGFTGMKAVLYEVSNTIIETIPLDYNDIHHTMKNPFRKPDGEIVWRTTENNIAILRSSVPITSYFYVYCKEITPIVLEDLPTNLDIKGVTTETTSVLPYDSVLQIIDLACKKILEDKSKFSVQVPEN